MKHRMILLVVLFTGIATAAIAQSSGSIVLQGTVPEILEITVTEEAAASSLDLTTSVTDLLVGTVVELSNKKAGYTVELESANAAATGSGDAFFKSADTANTDTLTYAISYGGAAVSLTSGTATVSDVTAKTASTGASNDVLISYDGASSFLYEDTYSDTLTFTITAK